MFYTIVISYSHEHPYSLQSHLVIISERSLICNLGGQLCQGKMFSKVTNTLNYFEKAFTFLPTLSRVTLGSVH